eukprot:scaffold7992_cov79-Skeletonema_dohrnii-CCMP3373.AAC.1
MDDSYVAKRGCPLSSPSSFVGQNHSIAAPQKPPRYQPSICTKIFVLRKRTKSRLRIEGAKKAKQTVDSCTVNKSSTPMKWTLPFSPTHVQTY